MKHIMVPTDFSPCAHNAETLAIRIANQAQADVQFMHMMGLPVDWVTLEQRNGAFYPEIDNKVKKADSSLCKLVKQAEAQGVNAKRSLVYTISYQEIIEMAKTNLADLIVMGSHGCGGIKEFLIGSNTQKIARLSPIPLLVAKEDELPESFENMVFATDFDLKTINEAKNLMDIAKTFNSKVHALYINTPANFHNTPTIEKMAEEFMSELPDLVDSVTIYNFWTEEEGILYFAKHMQADILAMITSGTRGLSRTLHKSVTETVINHAKVPVLSLNTHD